MYIIFFLVYCSTTSICIFCKNCSGHNNQSLDQTRLLSRMFIIFFLVYCSTVLYPLLNYCLFHYAIIAIMPSLYAFLYYCVIRLY